MISKEEVKHIAGLARLQLTEKEVVKMQKELSVILDYFNLLKETSNKIEASDLTTKRKIMRQDVIKSQEESLAKRLVEAAPDKKENHIKVKAVF